MPQIHALRHGYKGPQRQIRNLAKAQVLIAIGLMKLQSGNTECDIHALQLTMSIQIRIELQIRNRMHSQQLHDTALKRRNGHKIAQRTAVSQEVNRICTGNFIIDHPIILAAANTGNHHGIQEQVRYRASIAGSIQICHHGRSKSSSLARPNQIDAIDICNGIRRSQCSVQNRKVRLEV